MGKHAVRMRESRNAFKNFSLKIGGRKIHEDVGTDERRRFQNEELHSLYRSHNLVRMIKSRRMRWAGHVARMEEGRNAFKILTGTAAGKRPLGRPRRR